MCVPHGNVPSVAAATFSIVETFERGPLVSSLPGWCYVPGMMCVSVMAAGNHGMFRLHLCVVIIVCPFGREIMTWSIMCFKLTTRAPHIIHCTVVLALAVSHLLLCPWLLVVTVLVAFLS